MAGKSALDPGWEQVKMTWLAWLCLLHCALLVGCEAAARQFCRGTEGCSKVWHREVPRGESQSLILPLDATQQKLVLRCDPQTGKWKELLLAHSENSYPVSPDEKGISLVNQNFTVRNPDWINEGLYKITSLLSDDGTCLALVNITVMDHPLFVTAVPSATTFLPDTSHASPPGATEASPPGSTEASPGSNNIIIFVLVFVPVGIILIAVLVRMCIKRKSNESFRSTSALENGLCMDGLLPCQQQGNEQCVDKLLPHQ